MERQDIQPCKGCCHACVRQVTGETDFIFWIVSTKTEIVEAIAKNRMVETMVTNIAHQPLSADLKDLSQMVYLILLEYDEKKLQDLWENDQMKFFIARIIVNQYISVNSPFYTTFRKFKRMLDEEISISLGKDADNVEFDIMGSCRVLRDED